MKKRAMKKYIPKNTLYCHNCKWRKYIKTITFNKDIKNCPHNNTCDSNDKCWTTPSTSCYVRVFKCEYMQYTDWNEESLLWDGCKECGIGYPEMP